MKKLIIFIIVLGLGVSALIFALNFERSAPVSAPVHDTDEWMTNLETAMKLSEKTGKSILLEFAGSNWCAPCIILKKEVFSKKIFKDFTKKNLILVLIDFPEPSSQTKEQKEYNNNIARKYKIQYFPTVLLLDSKGKVIVETGYSGEDAQKYIEFLKSKMPAKK